MGFALKWVGDAVLGTWERFMGQSVVLSLLVKNKVLVVFKVIAANFLNGYSVFSIIHCILSHLMFITVNFIDEKTEV